MVGNGRPVNNSKNKCSDWAVGVRNNDEDNPIKIIGSGSIINTKGYLLTASHVAKACDAERKKEVDRGIEKSGLLCIGDIRQAMKLQTSSNLVTLNGILRRLNGQILPNAKTESISISTRIMWLRH